MKKVLFIFFVMAMSIITYAQIEVLNENFDAGALPAGWTTDDTDAAYANDIGPCGTSTFSFDCDANNPYWTYLPPAGFAGFQATMNDDAHNQNGIIYIYTPVMDLSGGGEMLRFDWEHQAFAGGGNFIVEVFDGAAWNQVFFADNDSGGHEDIDISGYFNSDFQVRFAYDDEGGFQWGAKIDNVVVSAFPATPPSTGCNLDCPGDMVVYLDPGDCCWAAQYNARTEGDCATHYDTILEGTPAPLAGFINEWDPTTIPEANPAAAPIDWSVPYTLNGPNGADEPYSGNNVCFTTDNLPAQFTMEDFDDPGPQGLPSCGNYPNGVNAYWSYTVVNFVATESGTLSFDWHYESSDISSFYDRFGYGEPVTWPTSNSFFFTNIYQQGGPLVQDGTFTKQMNPGDHLALIVGDPSGWCGADVTLSNMQFTYPEVRDGIVVAEGPHIGDPICDGETQTVKLHLLEHGNVIDSCEFDITVHEYQNPTTTLACNDNVQVSVDDQCVGMVTPDMILEGGPYGCYDDYSVQIFSSMPANVTGAVGDIPNPAPLGTWVVGVYDESGNNCWSTITVLDKIPPTIECACPVGGEYPAGAVVPSTISGAFTDKDLTAALHAQCWDFGTGDQVPDHGDHYYDVYAVNVSMTGDYAFSGGDGNKMLIGVFNYPFNAVEVCANMVGGMGGYVLGASGLFYSEPGGETVTMNAGTTYYVVVSDFDADYQGTYNFSITPPQGGEVTFAKTVYGADCEFAGCYEEGVDYGFVLPEFADNCSANLTWTQSVRDGEDCGTYIVTRHYTVTDG
ncbi:MAG TPA: hypothetical protein ENK91_13225, partial [Bacteroidetes bacterium]|nr:hypothetical protein [Bacteroidota bacterium]